MHPSSPASSFSSLTIDHAREILQLAFARAGVDGIEDLRPLRAPADNALIYVPELDAVARIAAAPRHRDRLARELATATWLSGHGIRTAVPASSPPTPQLEVIGGRVVSWWGYLPSSQPGGLGELGRLLSQMHAQSPPGSLMRLNPWARVEDQIAAAAEALPEHDIELLRREHARLIGLWESSRWADAPASAIHGDAYTGNTLVVDGETYLLDYEDAAIGPPAWDIASVLGAHQLGWIDQAGYAEFCRGYGSDLQHLPFIDVLVDIVLFRRCCWFASKAGRERAIVDAVRHRIHTLALPHHRKQWQRGGA